MKVEIIEAKSNGEAARLVAEENEYTFAAALGPHSAAEKYNLAILDGAFEDKEAITTFFLVAPESHPIALGQNNRVLAVFSVPHRSGTLVRALEPFESYGLNMIQIHSVHVGNQVYDFVAEIEAKEDELDNLSRALSQFKRRASGNLCFGPFQVLPK